MNLAQLRALRAVAEASRITDAARLLGVSQSAVSHTVASLERELGIRLVSRERAGSTLTETGTRLLPYAVQALELIDRLVDEAAAATGLQQGRLRIGAFPSAAQLLPPLMSRLTREHPGVEIVLLEGNDQEISDWIDDKVIEIGVVVGPRPDLDTLPLAEDQLLAVLSVEHPLASRRQLALAELADDPFLLSTGGCETLIRQLHAQRQVSLQAARRVSDMSTLLALVGENLGVSLVPELALRARPDTVVAIPLTPRAPRTLLLASAAGADLSPAARAFRNLAADAR